jgi:DNA invertase Pin-like site-specific DNA recombinase
MSTDRQEASIDRQRSQVLPYAEKHGYSIVKEFVDEGIPGDGIKTRPAFQRLLADAAAGKFQAILCDDQDRFGRFDSIDYGYVVKPLRDRGVWLDTVSQGRMDWDSFENRMVSGIRQEGKAMESVANSRRVLSAMLLRAQDGKYLGGKVAYGYKLEPCPIRGKKYVPDGHKADVVRFIFQRYADGATLGQIARELFERGVQSPTGGPRWSRSPLWHMLRKRIYVGDGVWGQKVQGKYHRSCGKGQLATTPRAIKDATVRLPESDWIVKENGHEPIVDRDLFARVQARLAGNQKRSTPHVGGGDFVLTRLLTCGHCGAYMLGSTRNGHRVYSCGNYIRYGIERCNANTVRETVLVQLLISKIQQLFLDPDNLQKLRDEVRARELANKSDATKSQLQKRIDGLERKIATGTERLFELPKDVLPEASALLAKLKRERDGVKEEMARFERQSPVDDLETAIAAAEKALWQLQTAWQDKDTALLRQTILETFSHVDLYFKHERQGKRTVSRLERGVIHLRPQDGLSNLFDSDCRRRSSAPGYWLRSCRRC